MSDVKKEVACQSNSSAMTSRPQWFHCGHLLHYASTPHNVSHTDKKGRMHKTLCLRMDLHHSATLDQ